MVDVAADELGAEVFELPFGRARSNPWPHVPRDGTGAGRRSDSRRSASCPARVRRPARRSGTCSATTRPSAAACTSSSTSTAATGRPRRRAPHVAAALRPADPAAAAARRSSRRRAGPAIVAGDCNFWGPGVRAFLPGLAARGARPHVAGEPAAQPDRPHPRAPGTPASWCSTARCCPQSAPTTARCGQHCACPDASSRRERRQSPVVGSKKLFTSATTLAGKPPPCAWHEIASSLSAR